MQSTVYVVDDFVNLLRTSLPLPVRLPTIPQGTAAEWIKKQPEMIRYFLENPESLIQVSDPGKYCSEPQLCVVHAAPGGLSFLFRSANGSRYCWDFASSVSQACEIFQTEPREIELMIRQYRFSTPFRNLALLRFAETLRLAVVMERIRFYPICVNASRTRDFLEWSIEAMKAEQKELERFLEAERVSFTTLH